MSNSHNYIHYDDPAVEPPIQNEHALQEKLFDTVKRTQSHNFSIHRRAFRGTHVKIQGILKGTFTVEPNLPEELAQGLCSPKNAQTSHPIALRYANEPAFLQDDRAPGPRGLGMKIFNIKGTFMDSAGEQSHTQDLTFNNAPILELRDLPTTVEIIGIRERNFRQPEKIPDELKKRDDAELQLAPSQLPNKHMLSYTMYSQSAYRWGPYVAKYALFPASEQGGLEKTHEIKDESSPEQHSTWLQDWFNGKEARYDLRVQLAQDLDKQPVEDCSVEWDEEKYPFRTVGRVVIPAGQDSFSAARRTFWEDNMKLNVWYGLEDHRPLGSANRLRKELYKRSVHFRETTNNQATKVVKSIDEIP